MPDPASYAYVSGNKTADGGPECWGSCGNMGIRLDGNDGSKVSQCKGPFYFVDGDMVKSLGAIEWHAEGDEWVFTCKDFVSPKSGLKYAFFGFTIYYSASPLVRQYTVRVNKNALHDVLRCYWCTVQPATTSLFDDDVPPASHRDVVEFLG